MLLSNYCKCHSFFNYLFIGIFSLICLSACGLSGDRNGTDGQSSTSGSSGGDDGDDTFDIKEKIGVRIERINGDVNKVSTTQISIVTLNENFQEIGSSSTPAYRVEPRLSGGFELQFSSSYVEKVNQVIKVTFDNTSTPPEFLYAPLYKLPSETQSITVNSKSHYVLKKLFDTISDSTELSQLIPCSNSSITCPNQSMAKSNFLEQINIAANAYNIDIDETYTVAQAMNVLDNQLDLRQQVETAVSEITRTTSPFSKATRRSFTFGTDGEVRTNLTVPLSYHSILFGLSFSNVKPDDATRSVKISSLSSTIVEPEDADSENPVYPGFNQTISLLDMRRDILSSDIPFERTNLEISQSNSFTLDDNEDLNSFTTELSDSFLSTQGFLLNERIIQQTIPNSIGWEFTPLFTKSYQVNEYEYPTSTAIDPPAPDYGNAPTWLVSSNYAKAASYRLSNVDGSLSREEQLEDSHIFSWEVHGLETNKDDNFNVSTMNGKSYGAISYSLKLDDQDDTNVIRIIAETAQWNINSGTILLSQPSDHYETLSLSRDDENNTLGVSIENNLLDTQRAIAALATEDSNGLSQQGLITFGGQSSGAPKGHSTSNGSYMALVFNTKDKNDPLDRGQGIILASELVNLNYTFSGEIYQLQGNSFQITPEMNNLHNYNGSSLTITDRSSNDPSGVDCNATLSIKRTSVEHTIGTQENTLSDPIETTLEDVTSESCSINSSEIKLSFGLVFGEQLTLRGFITQRNDASSTQPGNLINFIWEQDNQLGLIFATKELDLSPTFSD